MLTLTVSQRLELKAQAHVLVPVVIIGNAGLSESVLKEIDTALKSHQLVKVRAMSGDRDQREVMLTTICEQLKAAPVQHIGKMLIVYRPDLDKTIPIKKAAHLSKSKKPPTKKQLGNQS
jgi:putative YhbY family RNA-binding protein